MYSIILMKIIQFLTYLATIIFIFFTKCHIGNIPKFRHFLSSFTVKIKRNNIHKMLFILNVGHRQYIDIIIEVFLNYLTSCSYIFFQSYTAPSHSLDIYNFHYAKWFGFNSLLLTLQLSNWSPCFGIKLLFN